MKIKISKNNLITTVDQWQQYAPPKDKKQWKEGRSAMSLAQFMTEKGQIKKLGTILNNLRYNTEEVIYCIPEANTGLPGKGNGRNHDLLMIGEDFVVGIEAKVSEPFGNSIANELEGCTENKKCRIESLAKELFGCEVNEDIKDLKYQLLIGVMGTLIEAVRHSKQKALFLVIVFTDGITAKDGKEIALNNRDFAKFCRSLGLSERGGAINKLNIELRILKIEVSLKA